MKLPLVLLALALSCSAFAQAPTAKRSRPNAAAQVPPPAPPEPAPVAPREPVVTADLQCVTLPQAQALPLIAKLRSQKPAEEAAAVAEIATLLEKGTAKLIAWPSVTTRSGQRANCEQVEELRYPRAFESGTASIYLTDNEGAVTKQPSHVRGADIQPVATEFDTRNLGVSLEVEPTVSEVEITVPFKASHTLLKSIDRWAIEHEFTTEKKTEKIIQEQPRFTVYRADNIVFLKSGEHKLIGLFKTADPEPTMELFILGAEILDRK
jgi:Flp pilus assembly secretin CpaC